MAKMIPTAVRASTKSAAERQMFGRFKGQLDDGWTVFHSVGLGDHPRKPWAEIDFVAVGPAGVFSFEVKGGRIERVNGRWTFTDRNGQMTAKDEGPFDQVGSASGALHRVLLKRIPSIGAAIVGYGVVTPDVRFAVKGPDIIPEVVFDIDDTVRPLADYLSRVEAYWAARLPGRRQLTAVECRAICEFLRGDFDIHPTLGTLASAVHETLVSLTEEQYRVMDALEENDRVIIRGGAGTGKTMLAAAEAVRWSTAHEARVLFTCFNKNLAEFLKRSLGVRAPNVEVVHFHSLMHRLIREGGLIDRLPKNLEEASLYRVIYPEVAAKALDLGAAPFDVIVIDEGQDLLLDGYAAVLSGLVRGGLSEGIWRLFLDSRQDLYDASSRSALGAFMAGSPAQIRLTLNCRNTAQIALETALLSRGPLSQVLKADGPDVETVWFADQAEQSRAVAAKVRALLRGGIAPHEIALLSPFSWERSQAVANIRSLDVPVRDLAGGGWQEGSVSFSTIAGFKGLEADAVILMDGFDITETKMAAYYVGTSRARVFLTVMLHEAMREEFQESARVFGEHERLRVEEEARGLPDE